MATWGRFAAGEEAFFGLVESEGITPVAGSPFTSYQPRHLSLKPHLLKTLAPCVPGKIIAVGLNYRDHAKEFGHPVPDEPVLFLKAPSALLDPEAAILLPAASQQVDYEAELALVVRRTARRVPPEKSADYILGYTCLNDVTARDLQRKDGQWARAKSFDTFCPLGPYIITDLDPSDLQLELLVNGEVKQSSRTSQLIFDCAHLLSFVSHVMTLEPGDVITTGTPSGVGPLRAGDRVEVRIERVGVLINPVEARGW